VNVKKLIILNVLYILRPNNYLSLLDMVAPPFWYAVFGGGGGLGRKQYAKGQYAVRNNSVKSYAALKNNQLFNRFP